MCCWKCIKGGKVNLRKEKRMCCTVRERASSLRFSLSGESARVLCLYWRLGSFRGSTLAVFEPHRTGTLFSPSHLPPPPRRLFASSTPRVFCCAHSAVCSLRACVRSAGHRRANPNLFPQTCLSEPVCFDPVGTASDREASCVLSGLFE